MESQLLRKYPYMDLMQFSYVRLRSMGKSHEESYQELTEAEKKICPPYEQQMLSRIAIGDVMAENHELTESMGRVVAASVSEFLRWHPKMENTMYRVRDRILQPEHFGPPAAYPPWTEYRPPWEAGDVFCCTLQGYFPRLFLLEGKKLIIYVAGDRISESGFYEELVYLSICEEDHLPHNMDELNALGFLPGFAVFREYQYLYALLIRREKEIKELKLQKLGNFPGSPQLFLKRPDQERVAVGIAPAYAGRDKITLVRAACASCLHFGPIYDLEQARLAKKGWNYGLECRIERGEEPGSIVMDESTISRLSTRTLFHHAGTMCGKIPRESKMILED